MPSVALKRDGRPRLWITGGFLFLLCLNLAGLFVVRQSRQDLCHAVTATVIANYRDAITHPPPNQTAATAAVRLKLLHNDIARVQAISCK